MPAPTARLDAYKLPQGLRPEKERGQRHPFPLSLWEKARVREALNRQMAFLCTRVTS